MGVGPLLFLIAAVGADTGTQSSLKLTAPVEADAVHIVAKPDPESGGFTMPDSLRTQVRTNPEVSTDPAPSRRDDRWSDISGRTGSANSTQAQPASTQSPASQPQGSAPPSTGNSPSGGGESLDPLGRPTGGGSTAGETGRTASDNGRSDAAATPPSTTTPNAGSTSGPAAAPRSTDPSDPNWSGYGTTPTFGAMPPGVSPPTSARPEAPREPSTAPSNRDYQQPSGGYQLDRLGRPVDSHGRPVDPDSGHLVDAEGNWIDEYGHPLDRWGRPVQREPGTAAPPGSANLRNPVATSPGSSYPRHGADYYEAPARPPYPDPRQNAPYADAAWGYPPNSSASEPSGRYASNDWGRGGAAAAPVRDSAERLADRRSLREDDIRSPGDARGDSERTEERRSERKAEPAAAAPAPTRPRTVAPQPFFYFVALISVVANVYLIIETGNLRRKFRSVLAGVRASKGTAQGTG